MSGGGIEAVLRDHVIESVGGGTATGSRWRCRCGDSDVVPGTRDYAAHRGTAHVAAAVLAWLDARLAEGDVVEVVADVIGGEFDVPHGIHCRVAARSALSAVRGVLGGEGS